MRLFVAVEMDRRSRRCAELIDDCRAARARLAPRRASHGSRPIASTSPFASSARRTMRRLRRSRSALRPTTRRRGVRLHGRRHGAFPPKGPPRVCLGRAGRWPRSACWRWSATCHSGWRTLACRRRNGLCTAPDARRASRARPASLATRCFEGLEHEAVRQGSTWTRLHCSRAGRRRKGRPTCPCDGSALRRRT